MFPDFVQSQAEQLLSCVQTHMRVLSLWLSDTHRGRRRPADAGRSPGGSRWGTGAAARSWKRSMRSQPGWWGKSPARRSTDAGTWGPTGGSVARLQTQEHGRNSGGVGNTWGGYNRRKYNTKVHTYCTSFHWHISKQLISGGSAFHSTAAVVIWI